MTPAPSFLIGLDLGQMADFTALAAASRVWKPGPKGTLRAHYEFGKVIRYPLGTPYPDIVDDVCKIVATPPIEWPCLVIDATGLGRPVYDMFKRANPKATLRAVTITGGSAVSEPEEGCYRVAKKHLAGCIRACLDERRVQIHKGPLQKVLRKELENFKVKISAASNELYESGRENEHDDIVFAVGLALFMGERGGYGADVEAHPDAASLTSRIPRGVFREGEGPGVEGVRW